MCSGYPVYKLGDANRLPPRACPKTTIKCGNCLSCFPNLLRIGFVLCVLLDCALSSAHASCKTPSGMSLCCRGRQVTCSGYTRDEAENETVSSPNQAQSGHLLKQLISLKPCFCDEHCTTTGDCCPDYRDVCRKPEVNCEVGPWGTWGPCDRACGRGVRVRRRLVIKAAQNGGQHCPVLQETTPCEGYRCGSRRVSRSGSVMLSFLHRIQSEVAHLLPNHGDVLQMIRQWSMRWDVRRKLYLGRLIKQNKTEQPEPEPYCVMYEVTQRSHGCRLGSPTKSTDEEFVQRYSNGFRGYGRRRRRRNVVPSAFWSPNTFKSSADWDSMESWDRTWSYRVARLEMGQQICVTCYPGYMREDLGLRCSGTGLINVETRWRALRTADCHGKFRMLSVPQRGCTCGKGAASFIFV